ncbi:MAG: transposase [Acidobacteriota bacterium]|nr:transposase [Acidobacteriota bacterium]
MAYSAAIREAALQKLCAPYKPSLSSVAREFGISPETLREWRKWRRPKMDGETVSQPKRQQDWSMEERFQAVIDAGMSEGDLGTYCRRHGIYTNTLALWRENCLNAIRKSTRKDDEKAELKKKLKEANKELERKDKALAEASALLLLQKKRRHSGERLPRTRTTSRPTDPATDHCSGQRGRR